LVVSIVVVGVMIVDMGVGGTSVANVAAASVVLTGAAKAVVVVVDKILKFGNGVPEVFGVYKCVVTLGRNND